MIEKVTAPDKKVTDPVLLSALVKQGIDKDYVEFYQDYAPRSLGKEHSPYAKFYRDLISGKQFMVVSGLPMVDVDGFKIECGWKVAGINYFTEKNNLFQGKVQGTEVELTVRNDQPDGRKANDKLSYKPQIFLNGVPIVAGASTLLPVDPVNSNYLENTLEWDYGIAKRRLRIIQGRLLGCWVFPANPNGEIRIKYNQTGDYKLRLGQFKVNTDEEVIPQSVFDQAEYPFTVSDSATYYPDAHTETTSVDGYVTEGTDAIWATIKADAGESANDTDVVFYLLFFSTSSTTDIWSLIYRGIFLFDTSGLPDGATISAAVLSLYGYIKSDTLEITPNVCIYSSAPASNNDLVAGDYDSLGTTAFSNTITYANWLVADPFWNNFTLNTAGKAAISLTGVSKFGSRNPTYDVGTSTPTWVSAKSCYLGSYSAEQGEGYKPKLVVTYTAPTPVADGDLIGIAIIRKS